MKRDERTLRAAKLYSDEYGKEPEKLIFSPGRLELLGNHTDHNGGRCLVAGCSLGIRAAVGKADEVSIISEGYGKTRFSVDETALKVNEKGTTVALSKGVIACYKERGYKVGGFSAYINSDIFPGAGVSSSAAYELFIAETLNILYNDGKVPLIEKAKAGQYAENVYFGKASGLLDQCGSSFGGVQYLDFLDAKNPLVEPLPYPEWLPRIVLVNPGASHAGLSDLYSEMPRDMWLVAEKVFGVKRLGEVKEAKTALDALSKPIVGISDRARLRAIHFFTENGRVLKARKAFLSGDLQGFLALERETEKSQEDYLGNVMVPGAYEGSPLEAVRRAQAINPEGSARVMGGGLVGSIICFVDEGSLPMFREKMASYYGSAAVVEVKIPQTGASEVE